MILEDKGRKSRHKKKKRELEIGLILSHLKEFIRTHGAFSDRRLRILEIGAGDGYQIRHLAELGEVIASDVHVSGEIRKRRKQIRFIACDICALPFREDSFDIVFSNHVIEHIADKGNAFKELKRVGKAHCLYALSVPTSLWLLLSVPAQYYNKWLALRGRVRGCKPCPVLPPEVAHNDARHSKGAVYRHLADMILPHGHGMIRSFFGCLFAFKIRSWKVLYEANHLRVKRLYPLLLFAPSALPIIPMTERLRRFKVASSVLFLLEKHA